MGRDGGAWEGGQLDAKVNYIAVMHCVSQPAFPG